MINKILTTKHNTLKLIFYYFLILELFYVLPYLTIVHFFDIDTGGFQFKEKSLVKIFIIAVFFGPLLETFIFQLIVIYFVRKIFPRKIIIVIIISGLIFGLSHLYSLVYIFYASIIGFYLAYIYIFAQQQKINPFVIVFSIHSLHNLLMFFIGLL